MRTAVRPLVVGLLVVVMMSIPASYQSVEAQSAVLYDNFNSLLINPAKWYGNEEIDPALPPPQGAAEIFRGHVAGLLVMSHRLYGNPVNENINFHAMRLNIRNPEPITFIQATITVRQYQLQACPLNPEGGGVRVRLNGRFFNAGTPVPGNQTDDVIARVEIFRTTFSVDPSNVFRVRARVQRCLDATCSEVEIVSTIDLGTVNVGQATTVSVRWDELNGRFLFRRDGNPEVQFIYPWSDDAAPSIPTKGVILNSFVANCTAPTTVAFILATFDNFYVNP